MNGGSGAFRSIFEHYLDVSQPGPDQVPIMRKPNASWDGPRQDDLTPNLYGMLELHPSASHKKIKTAYRTLAKRLHPDVNAGDTGSDLLKGINSAYQILGDPNARAAYDAELALDRANARGRFWRGVAAGVSAFVLIASVSFLVALLILNALHARPEIGERAVLAQKESAAAKLHERDGAHPSGWARPDLAGVGYVKSPEDKARTSDELAAQPRPRLVPTAREEVASVPSAVPPAEETPPVLTEDKKLPRTEAVEIRTTPKFVDNQQPSPTISGAETMPRAKPSIWKLYLNARSGFALKYPADVFPLARTNVNKDRLLTSKDDRAVLHIFSMPNRAATFTEYRKSLMSGRYADASFDYVPQRSHWFALSGTVGDEMFYERATFSCDHRSIHGWVLVYPRAERALYEAIGAEIRSSYRDANARCSDLKS